MARSSFWFSFILQRFDEKSGARSALLWIGYQDVAFTWHI